MAVAADTSPLTIAWWREPTKDQWFAWVAALLGWMLDAFDFTIFLLIMAPIAKDFGVSVTVPPAGCPTERSSHKDCWRIP